MSHRRILTLAVGLCLVIALAAGAVFMKRQPGIMPKLSSGVATALAAPPKSKESAGASRTAAELPGASTVSLGGTAMPQAGEWDESQVTRQFWNRAQQLYWQEKPVDYVDADGTPQGKRPLAERSFSANDDLRIDLPPGLRDIYVMSSSGRVTVKTRETGDGPVLQLADGRRLPAQADAAIHHSTTSSLGKKDVMQAQGQWGFLIRFPPYEGAGTLILQRSGTRREPVTLAIYATNPRAKDIALPDALPAATSQVDRIAAAEISLTRPERQTLSGEWLLTWLDEKSAPQKNCSARGVTCEGLTLVQDKRPLAKPLDRAAMVIYFRIGGIWSDTGGKMPGLGNSGDTAPGKTCIEDGRCFGDAGWGGRGANGLRWHARGLFTGSGGSAELGWGTYLYALSPKSGSWGMHMAAAEPLPSEEVVATVQYIDVNDPGSDNGQLGEWLCRASGCKPMLWRDDIRYRTVDAPEALVNEVDLVVYCGGMLCRMAPGQRFEYDFHSVAIFDGMPDLEKVAGEVSRLASTAPAR